ncbi:hypothetical protein ABFO19_09800 [Xanthomonas citri pv. glycines]|uniref:hypothetical protein n=1 Tax=Xanthomonas TaxID=338 RepID=UPI000AF3D072|nr:MULTISPECIES: hypothetical protein [Xanthomonas]MCC8740362.1 hypothetical protein [Xanthomonas euvesicatoria pv. euvesicatoria]QTK36495.1 hypothetical protein XcgCFBP2526_10115 [Xanthomonas citri pv. glycines CFBP 2526]QTK40926.1 hypothetical protein XcgCFBP7119R_09950 [Xanthomonas citri pv. glycines]UIX76917.1 hypothetical protein LMJ37_04850 [Xanthomonas citri pv. glycines]WLA21663.1 hypothetical protein NDK37_09475 [Xanthomonas citri pv. glycines]
MYGSNDVGSRVPSSMAAARHSIRRNTKPHSLDAYFEEQGARLDRRMVCGKECLSLTVINGSRLYRVGNGHCIFGSERELWRAWCRQQRQFAWQKICARALIDQAFGQGGQARFSLQRWVESEAILPEVATPSPWPWSVLSRSDWRSAFKVADDLWTDVPKAGIEISILELRDVCVEDQFNIDRPQQYLRAFANLLHEAEREWLESETLFAQGKSQPRRL